MASNSFDLQEIMVCYAKAGKLEEDFLVEHLTIGLIQSYKERSTSRKGCIHISKNNYLKLFDFWVYKKIETPFFIPNL